NFEISAAYDIVSLPEPHKGNRVSCGIGVDIAAGKKDKMEVAWTLLFERGQRPGHKDGDFFVTQVKPRPEDDEPQYDTKPFRAVSKKGRLVLRRDKKDLICL